MHHILLHNLVTNHDCQMCLYYRLHQGTFDHQESLVVRDVQLNTWLVEDQRCIRTSYPFKPEVYSMRRNKAHVL